MTEEQICAAEQLFAHLWLKVTGKELRARHSANSYKQADGLYTLEYFDDLDKATTAQQDAYVMFINAQTQWESDMYRERYEHLSIEIDRLMNI